PLDLPSRVAGRKRTRLPYGARSDTRPALVSAPGLDGHARPRRLRAGNPAGSAAQRTGDANAQDEDEVFSQEAIQDHRHRQSARRARDEAARADQPAAEDEAAEPRQPSAHRG